MDPNPSIGPRWPGLAAAAVLALFVAGLFSEAQLKSPTHDEPPHIAAGLSYFVTHQIFRANPQHPPLLKELAAAALMASGVRWPDTPDAQYLVHGDDPARVFGLDWPIGNDILAKNGPDRVLAWARAPTMLLAAMLGAVLFLWGRQLFGAVTALFAVVVFALDPVVFAHSQLVTTDVGAAAFGMLALFALWNYLRRPGWARLILTGLAFGAALAAKFSALLLLPVAAVLLVATTRWPASGVSATGSIRKMALAFGVICGVAFVLIQAVYFFPGDLLMYARCAGMVNADHDPTYLDYMAGTLQRHFPSYFAIAYLLKEPIAAIVLTAIGVWTLLRRKTSPPLVKWFVLLPPAVFFLGVTVMADDLGVRYLLQALPFTHLLAGLGLAALVEAGRRSRRALAAAAALGAWLLIAAIGIYPDHLSYFNEAACALSDPGRIGVDGGTRCGTEWLDDSNVDWGQGMKQLKAWLDSNAPGRPVKFAFTASFPPDAYGIRYQRLGIEDLEHEPEPGLYVVSAHLVARTPAVSRGADWLRFIRPSAIVGHAMYVFDIRRQ